MKVLAERLCSDSGEPVEYLPTPNRARTPPTRLLIVIHYTAGRGHRESVNWLRNPKAKASAHLVIGRDGAITQLAEFDQIAWHAGASSWHHDGARLNGVNRFSIGIELDNPGRLQRTAFGYSTYWGRPVGADEVVVAPHQHSPDRVAYWSRFPQEQVLAAYAACEALIDAYPGLLDVVGHDDIAPGRKQDPGPAFPMESFRSWLFGRADDGAA